MFCAGKTVLPSSKTSDSLPLLDLRLSELIAKCLFRKLKRHLLYGHSAILHFSFFILHSKKIPEAIPRGSFLVSAIIRGGRQSTRCSIRDGPLWARREPEWAFRILRKQRRTSDAERRQHGLPYGPDGRPCSGLESLFGIEFLFTGSENELSATVFAYQRFVFVHDLVTPIKI